MNLESIFKHFKLLILVQFLDRTTLLHFWKTFLAMPKEMYRAHIRSAHTIKRLHLHILRPIRPQQPEISLLYLYDDY